MSVSVVGDVFIDMICSIEGIEPGETYHRNMAVTCGGSATVAVLAARLGEEAKFLSNAGEDVLEEMVDLAIITLGKDGYIVPVGKKHLQVPSDIMEGKTDTTGAGDAFSAGFIVGRLRQMNEIDYANLAHNTAATFLRAKVGLVQ